MLVQADHGSTAFESLYREMAEHFSVFDLRWLTNEEQADLRTYFRKNVDTEDYDRIVSFIRFKKEIKQVRFYRTLPNLVFLEYDACQNYMKVSKYRGVFGKHYKKIPWVKVISSGFTVTKKLKAEGIDATFVPKGFDNKVIYNLDLTRDIELGFVGNLRNKTYTDRRLFLEKMTQTEGLVVTKTAPGVEYNKMLNRIKYFISADIGIGEYMQKNFEAMAAGCVVFAYDQGEAENKAFGLVDMNNIILYKDKKELLKKKSLLDKDTQLFNLVRSNGILLSKKFTNLRIANKFSLALQEKLKPRLDSNFFSFLGFK